MVIIGARQYAVDTQDQQGNWQVGCRESVESVQPPNIAGKAVAGLVQLLPPAASPVVSLSLLFFSRLLFVRACAFIFQYHRLRAFGILCLVSPIIGRFSRVILYRYSDPTAEQYRLLLATSQDYLTSTVSRGY